MSYLEIINEIMQSHIGKHNSITSSEIASRLGIVEDDTHAKTRDLMFESAKIYKLPLAADNSGYYLISNEQEFNDYINNLDSRIKGIELRKEIITKNYKGE